MDSSSSVERNSEKYNWLTEQLVSLVKLPDIPYDEARLFVHPAASPTGALLGGILLNHTINPLEKPMIIAKRMGLDHLDIHSLREKGKESLVAAIRGSDQLCQRPGNCALIIWRALDYIDKNYAGDPERIWNKGTGISVSRLIRRFERVPGIGKSALEVADIFTRCWFLPILGDGCIKLDYNTAHVAMRLGLRATKLKLAVYRGIKHLSHFCCWENNQNCGSCPISNVCGVVNER